MTRVKCARESGQAVVEFALIGTIVMLFMVGLADVGRAFYQYNAMSAAARYGARWGSVVGGSCGSTIATSTSDWCNQLGASSSKFWYQAGNTPIQGAGADCPSYTSVPADYYAANVYLNSTVVGAVAQKLDSSSSSSSFVTGRTTPGFDLSQLKVCIALTQLPPSTGDKVTVNVFYPFSPAGHLLGGSFNMDATSTYVVEGGVVR